MLVGLERGQTTSPTPSVFPCRDVLLLNTTTMGMPSVDVVAKVTAGLEGSQVPGPGCHVGLESLQGSPGGPALRATSSWHEALALPETPAGFQAPHDIRDLGPGTPLAPPSLLRRRPLRAFPLLWYSTATRLCMGIPRGLVRLSAPVQAPPA